MIDNCDASNHPTDCRRDGLRRKTARGFRRCGILAAVLLVGGCSWFTDDEPAFPPTAGGPNIATVPEGLGSDTANAEYSDQDLSVQTESAPRPAPPPPPAPKEPEAEAPSSPAPTASTATPPASTEQTGTPPAANTVPAAAPAPSTPAPSAATKPDKGSYPDINSVPMQAPTPVPDPDAPPATQPATPPATPSTDPQKSSQAMPAAGKHIAALIDPEDPVVTTAAGPMQGGPQQDTAVDKETDLAQAVAAQTSVDDDNGVMFSRPSLPPYIPYDQMQKQAQTREHAPYPVMSETGGTAPVPLGPAQPGSASETGQAVAVDAPGIGQPVGVQAGVQNGAQPVGLVYFSDGSVNLSADDRRILQQIAKPQQTFGGVVRIIGHASSRTENMPIDRHQKSNVDVSVARAAAVARQLVRFGVDPNFVQVAGVSDSRPVYPEIMPAGEAANRRAEIYLSSN
ncbi:MAG: OmpA family protein [Dongiaceae bacterium]